MLRRIARSVNLVDDASLAGVPVRELQVFSPKAIARLLATTSMASALLFAPVHVEKTPGKGLAFGWSAALAEKGSGKDGDGGGGSDDDDSDDDEDDDDSDGDDDGDDNSGPGGGDDDDDDDDDNSGSGSNGGSGGSGGSGGGNGSGTNASGGADPDVRTLILNDGTRVEILKNGREIRLFYANGWREEIRNGRYELRDNKNRRVVERPAESGDYARLQELLNS